MPNNEANAAEFAHERLTAARQEAENFVARSEMLFREQDEALRASGEMEARLTSERHEAERRHAVVLEGLAKLNSGPKRSRHS